MQGLFGGDFGNGTKAALNEFATPYATPFNIFGGLLGKAGFEDAKSMPGTTKWMKDVGILSKPEAGLSADIGKYAGAALLPGLITGKMPTPQQIAMSLAMSYLQNKFVE